MTLFCVIAFFYICTFRASNRAEAAAPERLAVRFQMDVFQPGHMVILAGCAVRQAPLDPVKPLFVRRRVHPPEHPAFIGGRRTDGFAERFAGQRVGNPIGDRSIVRRIVDAQSAANPSSSGSSNIRQTGCCDRLI